MRKRFYETVVQPSLRRNKTPFFAPTTDEIRLPEFCVFTDAANFYATGLHELIHWSGAKSRLNREMKGKFGSEGYAFEELIAELGTAFLMADLVIAGEVHRLLVHNNMQACIACCI